MVAAYSELLTPHPFNPTTFPNDEGYDELIVVRAIPFHSLCMHHLLPFHGVAHIGYLPGERLIGLSKLGRVVEHFSRDLQLQERLTTQVADWLDASWTEGRRGGPGGGAPLHVAARRAEARRHDHHIRAARAVPSDARTRQEFMALTTRTPMTSDQTLHHRRRGVAGAKAAETLRTRASRGAW